MLYILTHDYELHTYTDEGALCKHVSLCPCESCDADCDQCASEAECPHDNAGHTGGLCVSRPLQRGDTITWQRLHYYHSYRGLMDCSCRTPCAHPAKLIIEAQRHTTGHRSAGTGRRQFLATRPRLRPPEQSASAPDTHKHTKP